MFDHLYDLWAFVFGNPWLWPSAAQMENRCCAVQTTTRLQDELFYTAYRTLGTPKP